MQKITILPGLFLSWKNALRVILRQKKIKEIKPT